MALEDNSLLFCDVIVQCSCLPQLSSYDIEAFIRGCLCVSSQRGCSEVALRVLKSAFPNFLFGILSYLMQLT